VESLCKETGITYEDIEIAGAQVMMVTPRDYDSANDDRCILYYFGGAYVVGSPFEDLVITAQLATMTGMKVYAPWYRLAPEHPYPAALNDGIAVYEDLIGKMRVGGLTLAGESAGGNLALVVALRAREMGLPMPAALGLFSPWSDLTDTSESGWTHAGLDPTFPACKDDGSISQAYGGGADLRDPMISPVYADYTGGFPPTLITTGTRDMLMSDCARLSTNMRLAGVDVRLHLWEGMWHVFEYYPELPEARKSMREVAAFLKDHTV
jgi:acetyl esterase/lipase